MWDGLEPDKMRDNSIPFSIRPNQPTNQRRAFLKYGRYALLNAVSSVLCFSANAACLDFQPILIYLSWTALWVWQSATVD